jgi:S1-C subfamily serine protease
MGVPGIRVRDDLAVAVAPPGSTVRAEPGTEVLGSDRATGLTVIRLSGMPRPPALSIWPGPPPRATRYLMAAESTPAGVTLRPFLARGATEQVVKGWRQPLWRLPNAAVTTAGTALFTTNAELVGIVVNDQGTLVLAPAQTILDEMDQLLTRNNRAAGELAIEVEAVTPDVGALVGVMSGLIVTWVDPSGPAAKVLQAGDVIQQVDGQQVETADDWLLAVARILEGDEVQLDFVRGGAAHDARLTAAVTPLPAPPKPSERVRPRAELGLEMRMETGQGIAVRAVTPGSRAGEAGLVAGDLITRAGNIDAPTPAQLRQAFAKGPVLLNVTRGERHHVLALQP